MIDGNGHHHCYVTSKPSKYKSIRSRHEDRLQRPFCAFAAVERTRRRMRKAMCVAIAVEISLILVIDVLT